MEADPLKKPSTSRVTADLTLDEHQAIGMAYVHDRIPHATRVRALLRLWMEDPELRERTEKVGTELRGQTLERQRAARRKRSEETPAAA